MDLAKTVPAMHVAVNAQPRVNKAGVDLECRWVLLRTSFREAGRPVPGRW